MKVVTWNCNAVRPRQARLLAMLARHQPDVLCLQEVRAPTGDFPALELLSAGYHSTVHGQKGRNGVAILSRERPEAVLLGLADADDESDKQSRLVAATVAGVRVLSAYPPNGAMVGSADWEYKLRWFMRLREHLEERYQPSQPLLLCGDLNVSPEARDVHDPRVGERQNYYHPRIREAYQEILRWGLVDVFRQHEEGPGHYTWWDYRMRQFEKNIGLRLDYILATKPLAERCTRAWIDRDERAGETPSDHAPVVAELA